ncbi:MAG: hypothetical protein OXL68_06440 [Paracoccaceae bacterium]|nr:hypothetical protein [Paracoccaceae bacterium]
MSFNLNFNWVDPGPSPDAVMRRTMARFSIEVDGRMLTVVQDRKSGRYRKQIVVPLFAVANWLVDNWWYLWHEPADTHEQKPGFEERHNLAYAGQGFLLPKLTIAPSSERIHLVARRWEPDHALISFVEEVDTYVEVEELRQEFQRLIDFVLRRLKSLDDNEEAVQLSEAWAAINDLDPEEQDFSRAAAMCGIDPFNVEDGISEAIVAFWERIEPSIREEALAAADARSLPQLGDWLVHAVEDLASVGNENHWNEIRDHVPASRTQEPWKQGYELAQSVRDMLGLGQDPFQFMFEGPFAVFHQERNSPSRRIEGIVAATTPACVMASRGHSSGTRFLMARALGEFVSRKEPRLGIVGSLHNDRQALTRAFAAEFLAPAEVLYRQWSASKVPEDEVDKLSQEFDVSTRVIWHQIDNYKREMSASW